MELVTKEEFAKALQLNKFPVTGLTGMLMELMKINDLNKTLEKTDSLEGAAFAEKALELFGIKVELGEDDLKHIPTTGPFIAIANHPYGGIEGLLLLKVLCAVRPDVKFMANFLLKKIPQVREYVVAVNPFENIDHASSISGIKCTLELLRAGSPVVMFPAGEVSAYQFDRHHVTDKQWHPVVEKLIVKARVPIVPIYFHGGNGLIFNLLGLIHPSLRTAKLPSELFNKKGLTIKIRIGKPIKVDETTYRDYPGKLLGYLRARTYALGAGLENERKLFSPTDLFKVKKKPKDIAEETGQWLIEKEIDGLRNTAARICAEKSYEVYITPVSHIPAIIKEIGRLREITFREVGEGTNKAFDLDRYDLHYLHLFMWDTDKKQLVGAYRMGMGDLIFDSIGKKGFYTHELFKMKAPLYPVLRKSIELGRSWIRKEYQQKALPLFLLWKGVLKYTQDHPQYQYLIGPVSISNRFSRFSKSLIVDYILKNHFDSDLAESVKPRKKFKPNFSRIDPEVLLNTKDSFKDLDNLISEVESNHRKIPVLLRQYMALNAKIICFNIDPKFSDSLDGFLVLDVKKVPQDMIGKLVSY